MALSSSDDRGSDTAAAATLLVQISSQLSAQQFGNATASSDLKKTLRSLGSVSSPPSTVALIVPRLFLAPTASSPVSSENVADGLSLGSSDALSVLGVLVSIEPDAYLKPVSRAVRAHVESLASNAAGVGQRPVEASDAVLGAVVAQLSGNDVEVSENAEATLTALSRLVGPPLQDRAVRAVAVVWKDIATAAERGGPDEKRRASTVTVRCASAIVSMALLGDAAMESATSNGADQLLMGMVSDPSDPLLQVSAIDLLERMATTLPMYSNRARWLFSHSVLHELLVLAGGGGHGEEKVAAQPDPILGGPALHALSSLCRLGQRDPALFAMGGSELLTGFHRSLHGFEEHLNGELDKLAFVDAVSSFAAASPDAAACVLDDPVVRDGWMTMTVAQPKLKSVVIHSVAMTIDPPVEKDSSGDTIMDAYTPSNALAMRLFNTLGNVNGHDPTELVLSSAKSPLVEIRLGAYELLRAIAKRGTGAQILLSHEDFYDFLLEREKETTKEGKEAKFEIVRAVLQSDARALLADSIVDALEKHIDQGAHYIKTQPWELATE